MIMNSRQKFFIQSSYLFWVEWSEWNLFCEAYQVRNFTHTNNRIENFARNRCEV